MKYLRYILAISILAVVASERAMGCGPYAPDNPDNIFMFRCCSAELQEQWREGCRFQEYEKERNCLLWQSITSAAIPTEDICQLVYAAPLSALRDLTSDEMAKNKFARWLSDPRHSDDLDYILIAKEIEEIRDYFNDPWYYPYEGDEEHQRLDELMQKCRDYKGGRHAARYGLQMIRLLFAKRDFQSCVRLWEETLHALPRSVVTDMIASYVGGAYSRFGDRAKAIELFTLSEDIGSLINLKEWKYTEAISSYTDTRVKELEYLFNRFPASPLLSVYLQRYVRSREKYANFLKNRAGNRSAIEEDAEYYGYDIAAERTFGSELKRFVREAAASPRCRQKGMWLYALGYLYCLDEDLNNAAICLRQAEEAAATPLYIRESIRAFRFLMDAKLADNSAECRDRLLHHLEWLDKKMMTISGLNANSDWHFSNKLNWEITYWQDVARKVLLGNLCPRIRQAGNSKLALQLANFASNHIYQIASDYYAYNWRSNSSDVRSGEMSFDDYRRQWPYFNYFDFSNQFFEALNRSSADEAARYAEAITRPTSRLDKFLNDRGFTDTDYIFEIVGTLYLREMNYEKASRWLSKVSTDYQSRTNVAKEGYFRLDPFKYQADRKHFIADSTDYKLRFADEMIRLQKIMRSDAEPNRKAQAKIRYATGLRNSFGRCWYLTDYSYSLVSWNYENWDYRLSSDRDGFKDNAYAQQAYRKVDRLMKEALSEFTDPEKAAQAHLEMMNYATLIKQFPESKAAANVRGRCDNYYDYALQKR